jgi:chromate transport protein ChrA
MTDRTDAAVRWLIPALDLPWQFEEGKLRKELDIVGRARADAVENRPSTEDAEPNEVQKQIIDRCHKGLADLREHNLKRLRRVAEALEANDLTPADRDLESPADDARHAVAKLRGPAREALIARRVEERKLQRERACFKADHGLRRSAIYPASGILSAAVVALLILTETVINANLFAQASEFGLLGGWLQVLAISVPNVLTALLLGFLALRYAHHVSPVKRALGMAAMAPGLIVLFVFNLMVAHYRVLLDTDPDHAIQRVAAHFLANPWNLESWDAILLLLLGLLTAVLAMIEGFVGLDDRYPGYGKIDRRYRAADAAYQAEKRGFRERIEKTVGQAIGAIDRGLAAIRKKVLACARLVNEGRMAIADYERNADGVARTQTRLLRLYREENLKIRTRPAPAYFNDYPTPDTTLGSLPVNLQGKKQELFDEADSLFADGRAVKGRLHELAEREIQTLYDEIDQLEAVAEQKAEDEARADRDATSRHAGGRDQHDRDAGEPPLRMVG